MMDPNPDTKMDKAVNDLRLKYMTFLLSYMLRMLVYMNNLSVDSYLLKVTHNMLTLCFFLNLMQGAVMLPGHFVTDFGVQIGHFVIHPSVLKHLDIGIRLYVFVLVVVWFFFPFFSLFVLF